jgi:hypothetical protein
MEEIVKMAFVALVENDFTLRLVLLHLGSIAHCDHDPTVSGGKKVSKFDDCV